MKLSPRERHDIESALTRLKIFIDLYAENSNKTEIIKSARNAVSTLEHHLVNNLLLRSTSIEKEN